MKLGIRKASRFDVAYSDSLSSESFPLECNQRNSVYNRSRRHSYTQDIIVNDQVM
jgi:hypothetical protein